MPCYLATTIKLEKFKVRRDILPTAVTAFVAEMEPLFGRVTVLTDGGIVRVNLGGEVLSFDLAAGQVSYSQPIRAHVEAFKRCYSMAVVKHVSGRSRMKQHFTIRQTGEHELVLQRRR